MPRSPCARRWRALLLLAAAATPCVAQAPGEIVVTGDRATDDAPVPSKSSIDAATIATTVNAATVEDTLKYLPGLVVRARHIGDTQSPLATRTSGVGASARSLIYADGALLSALIGNNNTLASPRWEMVSPHEIARIDVLYGPYAAAYPGNSIGAVIAITTRLPDRLEATATLGVGVQRFAQYGTLDTLPTYQAGATFGDRIGPIAVFASIDRLDTRGQPLAYATAVRAAQPSAAGSPATGGYDDVNRTGAPIRVLGAAGEEHQHQTRAKLKAALDLAPSIRLTYVGGLFVDRTRAGAESYLADATGAPVYAGTLNIAGYAYTIPASAFATSVYAHEQRHWSHSLALDGAEGAFDWHLIGTSYAFSRDIQRFPGGALPGASGGGPGTITRLEGTGWTTLDARAGWRSGAHAVSGGAHGDRFVLASDRYATADWIGGSEGALNLASRGRTRTAAAWVQDAWTFAPPLTLTLGGRQEWWRAYGGANFSAAPALDVRQPVLRAARFSPKASLAWAIGGGWSLTGSFGEAWRFPTVSELYQVVATGASLSVPNPNLRPERALSEELALERRGRWGSLRLSLFGESIRDALLAQTAPVNGGAQLASYVQNVDRVRTHGTEIAFDLREVVRGVDLAGSVTLVDPRIRADAAFPAAIGKRPPQVPRRKATLVATWRPIDGLSLTAAGRYASRSFGTIDNSDPVSRTYQGFGGYVVADLRAVVSVGRAWRLGLGADNIGARRYFLFHPFPQRSFRADLTYRL